MKVRQSCYLISWKGKTMALLLLKWQCIMCLHYRWTVSMMCKLMIMCLVMTPKDKLKKKKVLDCLIYYLHFAGSEKPGVISAWPIPKRGSDLHVSRSFLPAASWICLSTKKIFVETSSNEENQLLWQFKSSR